MSVWHLDSGAFVKIIFISNQKCCIFVSTLTTYLSKIQMAAVITYSKPFFPLLVNSVMPEGEKYWGFQ